MLQPKGSRDDKHNHCLFNKEKSHCEPAPEPALSVFTPFRTVSASLDQTDLRDLSRVESFQALSRFPFQLSP